MQRNTASGKLTNLFKLKMMSKPAPHQTPLGADTYNSSSGPAGIATPAGGSLAGSGMSGAGTPGGVSGASPRTPPFAAAAAAAAAAASAAATAPAHPVSADEMLTWSNVSGAQGVGCVSGGRVMSRWQCLEKTLNRHHNITPAIGAGAHPHLAPEAAARERVARRQDARPHPALLRGRRPRGAPAAGRSC